MRLKNFIVPLSIVLVLGLMNGRAEASRMAFNGAGSQGAIVWDENGDVSTMANDCGGAVCETSVFGLLPADFGFLVTTEDPGGLAGLNIASVHMLLSVTAIPTDPCSLSADVQCGSLSDFAGLSDSGWQDRATLGDAGDRVDTSTQPLIRLAMVSLATQPGFYALTQDSLDFLATLDPTILAAAHVGADVTRFNPNFSLTPFAVETASPSPVPEPGSLLLLGSGLAMLTRMRRRAVR